VPCRPCLSPLRMLTCGHAKVAAEEKAAAEKIAKAEAEALVEAASAEKAGVLCGVWGGLGHPLGDGGVRGLQSVNLSVSASLCVRVRGCIVLSLSRSLSFTHTHTQQRPKRGPRN
jgi:hypothetical protein